MVDWFEHRSLRSTIFKTLRRGSGELKDELTPRKPSVDDERPRSRSFKDRLNNVRRTSEALEEEDKAISENLDTIFKQMKLPDDKIGEEFTDQGDYWQNQFVQVSSFEDFCFGNFPPCV